MNKNFLRSFVAGTGLLLGSFAMNGCDTTGNGGEVPNPQPKPVAKVETIDIKSIYIDDAIPSLETLRIGIIHNNKAENYLNTENGKFRFEFTGDIDINNIDKYTNGFESKFTKRDSLKQFDVTSGELLRVFVTVPSDEVESNTEGWSFSYNRSPEEWKERYTKQLPSLKFHR